MKRSRSLIDLACVLVAVACSSSDGVGSGERGCEPIGKSAPCQCDDGRMGARVCGRDGASSGCECTGSVDASVGGAESAGAPAAAAGEGAAYGGGGAAGAMAGAAGEEAVGGAGDAAGPGSGGACHTADVAGCRCPDRLPSYRLCEDGAFGRCHCGPMEQLGAGGAEDETCLPEAEVCDGLDNDCDGLVDDGYPCPDDSVWSTARPTQAAYLVGELDSAECSRDTLHQVWPGLSDAPIEARACRARSYRIRRSDSRVFYAGDPFSGIWLASAVADPVAQPTPPCIDPMDLGSGFDFDEKGVIHYLCRNALVRGSGEVVAGAIGAIAGVLDDGRSIVTRSGELVNDQYAIISSNGEELSRFPPPGFYAGAAEPLPRATSIEGRQAYVALSRGHRAADETMRSEIIVYRVDAESSWRFVRRTDVEPSSVSVTVFADGTILTLVRDFSTSALAHKVVAYLPDNTTKLVWQEDHASFKLKIGPSLYVGPAR